MLSFFQTNGTAYIVIGYVEGVTFKQHLEQQGGKIPFEAALKVLVQVMDALGALAATLYRAITGQVSPEAPCCLAHDELLLASRLGVILPAKSQAAYRAAIPAVMSLNGSYFLAVGSSRRGVASALGATWLNSRLGEHDTRIALPLSTESDVRQP
jgi:hypothetical protein